MVQEHRSFDGWPGGPPEVGLGQVRVGPGWVDCLSHFGGPDESDPDRSFRGATGDLSLSKRRRWDDYNPTLVDLTPLVQSRVSSLDRGVFGGSNKGAIVGATTELR